MIKTVKIINIMWCQYFWVEPQTVLISQIRCTEILVTQDVLIDSGQEIVPQQIWMCSHYLEKEAT